jgi:hypothetical protein
MNDTQDSGGSESTSAPVDTQAAASTGVGSTADESFGWTAEPEPTSGGGDARAAAERMLGQLQDMIDTVATQAAPVVRQIGAKAAELAAVAADRAGPLAQRAAEATADASERLAERSRTWAAELRSHVAADREAGAAGGATATLDPAEADAEAAPTEPTGDAQN